MLAIKGIRFLIDVIPVCIRWYAAYPLSYRHLGEIMHERSVFIDYSSIDRWAIRFLPLLKKSFANTSTWWAATGAWTKPINLVKGVWKYLYRAVDRECKTVDILQAAKRAANKAAIDKINSRGETPIIVRQVKYLNNIVEQDH